MHRNKPKVKWKNIFTHFCVHACLRRYLAPPDDTPIRRQRNTNIFTVETIAFGLPSHLRSCLRFTWENCLAGSCTLKLGFRNVIPDHKLEHRNTRTRVFGEGNRRPARFSQRINIFTLRSWLLCQKQATRSFGRWMLLSMIRSSPSNAPNMGIDLFKNPHSPYGRPVMSTFLPYFTHRRIHPCRFPTYFRLYLLCASL